MSLRGISAVLVVLLAACSSAPRRVPPEIQRVPPLPTTETRIPADAELIPRIEARSAKGNPPFYQVAGKRYTVLVSAAGYSERGVASWYGPDFHGKSTSSGEPYDMYGMTAAHKTLPLPCYARVTNLSNGRSVVVRVNDRGPFVSNRVIDLSYTAASRLDMIRNGTAFVEVQALAPSGPLSAGAPLSVQAAEAAPPPRPTTQLAIQVGAYGDEANARATAARLQSAGLAPTVVTPAARSRLTRVRIAGITSVEQFDRIMNQLRTLGFPDARLATDQE
jgi:rare lipoprotein A